MNEEERKSFEYLDKYTKWETFGERNLEGDIKTILNLVEKQETRIQELEKINTGHQKINGKLRNELNLLEKQKQDVLDFLEIDCEGDYD